MSTQLLILRDVVRFLQDVAGSTYRTHIHKTLFFAKHRLADEIPFEFVLHHFGPYSFDLDQEIAEAVSLKVLDSRPAQMGRVYTVGPEAEQVRGEIAPEVLDCLGAIAKRVGALQVKELERLATALWVLNKGVAPATVPSVLMRIKPHITPTAASTAVQDLLNLELLQS